MGRFAGKVVVITGASAGIGRAIAVAFAKESAKVGILSRNQGRLASLKTEIEGSGGKAFAVPLDVADHAAIEAAAERIEEELGPIDVWVNNAMVSVFSPVKEMLPEEFKRVIEVTYLGVVYGTLAALRRMLRRDRGRIIQIGSALAYRGIPLQSAYSAAKHAVQGFQDSLYTELLHDGSNVRTTMIQLAAFNTPQFDWAKSRLPNKAQPVPPIFQPELAAKAVLHAALHPRREYVVGWPALKAIWGNNLFPAYGDRYLAKRGYASQQTDELKPENAPENLWTSPKGEWKVHGRFGDRSKPRSIQWWLTAHRSIALWVAAVAILSIMIAIIV